VISLRSKCLIGIFAVAPVTYAIVMISSFRFLRQLQALTQKQDPATLTNAFLHSFLFRFGPTAVYIIVFCSAFAILSLISLAFDNRYSSSTNAESGRAQQ
jgi:hypothetical protein